MRLAILIGGLCGAAGVGLSAYAAHAGGGNAGTAAQMLLFHAPAFLALGFFPTGLLRSLALLALTLGLALFCGDLLAREFLGSRLFPMAAPAGGMALIAGWLFVAVSGLVRIR